MKIFKLVRGAIFVFLVSHVKCSCNTSPFATVVVIDSAK